MPEKGQKQHFSASFDSFQRTIALSGRYLTVLTRIVNFDPLTTRIRAFRPSARRTRMPFTTLRWAFRGPSRSSCRSMLVEVVGWLCTRTPIPRAPPVLDRPPPAPRTPRTPVPGHHCHYTPPRGLLNTEKNANRSHVQTSSLVEWTFRDVNARLRGGILAFWRLENR